MQELITILDRVKSYYLTIAAVLYTSGLICWCFYSWENNLGHVDAFQLQYIVAGIIPGTIIFYIFWLFKYSEKNSENISIWLERNLIILRIGKTLLSLFVLIFMVDIIFKFKIFEGLNAALPAISVTLKNILIFLLFNIIIILSPALLTIEDETSVKKSKFIQVLNYFLSIGNLFITIYLMFFRFSGKPIVTIIAILMLLIYYFELYPILPQEIGGVRPKNAILIIEPSAFSIQDSFIIFPDSTGLKAGQTDTLSVYFYNDTKFIFKTHKDVIMYKTQAKTFEIARSSIKSVKWIN
jgi:hypothetical protein